MDSQISGQWQMVSVSSTPQSESWQVVGSTQTPIQTAPAPVQFPVPMSGQPFPQPMYSPQQPQQPQPQQQHQQMSMTGFKGPPSWQMVQQPPLPPKYSQQQQTTQTYSGFCAAYGQGATRVMSLKNKPSDPDLKLSAVVATIRQGNSYDPIFQQVPQEGVQGTYVMTYQITGSVKPILHALKDGAVEEGSALQALVLDIGFVKASSVVFNWECCEHCARETFGSPEESEATLDFIEFLLHGGHMVMCSDFSLKALIKQWCPRRLGPNPFVKVGEFGGTINLKFDSARIAECPSQQLQQAGQLSESGTATIHAMPSTIMYTVDKNVDVGDWYNLEVLSVATCASRWELPQNQICTIGDSKGTAGHVLLSYRSHGDSPGLLLTSAGHWVEIVKLDNVSEEKLLQTAARTYG